MLAEKQALSAQVMVHPVYTYVTVMMCAPVLTCMS